MCLLSDSWSCDCFSHYNDACLSAEYDTPLYRSVSHLSSDKDDEIERQKRGNELERFEKVLGKNCILFRNLTD